MIWHPIYLLVTGLLNGLYAALPPLPMVLGGGYSHDSMGAGGGGNGIDHGLIHDLLCLMGQFDKYLPVRYGFLPISLIFISIWVGMMIFKGVKFVLSLIPTISAGG